MCKALYQNIIVELGIGIACSFPGMALNTFWKRAFHIIVHCYAEICFFVVLHPSNI